MQRKGWNVDFAKCVEERASGVFSRDSDVCRVTTVARTLCTRGRYMRSSISLTTPLSRLAIVLAEKFGHSFV